MCDNMNTTGSLFAFFSAEKVQDTEKEKEKEKEKKEQSQVPAK